MGLKAVSLLSKAGKALATSTDDVARYVKACGKRSILETKPLAITKDTVFAYKPNYDKAFSSWEKSLLAEGYGVQEARTVAKEAVNKTMTDFGRPLESSIFSSNMRRTSDPKLLDSPLFAFGEDASTYAMEITKKARAVNRAKYNPFVAEKMRTSPELFALDETERLSKNVLDKAFTNVKPNSTTTVEYRGALIPKNSVDYQNITKLKKGDIHTEQGYIWTSPESGYAFGRYSVKPLGDSGKASIRSHILLPEGSQTLHVDRFNPETLLGYNSQFKVCNIKKEANGDIELFLEYLKA